MKKLINCLKNDFNKEERKEIIEKMLNKEKDFELFNYRFIHNDDINEILKEELLGDKYFLGCFADWFIADICDLSIEVVMKAQKDESFELLGELMAKNIDDVVECCVDSDGYGNHFAHYDGEEKEAGDYYYFKVN